MGNLYKTIEYLCSENGVNITTMCSESGASRGSLTDLKMGRKQSLSAETLSKIASYFGVSVDYLLGNDEKPATDDGSGLSAKEERDIARKVEKLMSDLEAGGDLMFDGDPMSPEAMNDLRTSMLIGYRMARERNKEKYTPKKYKKNDD